VGEYVESMVMTMTMERVEKGRCVEAVEVAEAFVVFFLQCDKYSESGLDEYLEAFVPCSLHHSHYLCTEHKR
jgi:hypothetical protein